MKVTYTEIQNKINNYSYLEKLYGIHYLKYRTNFDSKLGLFFSKEAIDTNLMRSLKSSKNPQSFLSLLNKGIGFFKESKQSTNWILKDEKALIFFYCFCVHFKLIQQPDRVLTLNLIRLIIEDFIVRYDFSFHLNEFKISNKNFSFDLEYTNCTSFSSLNTLYKIQSKNLRWLENKEKKLSWAKRYLSKQKIKKVVYIEISDLKESGYRTNRYHTLLAFLYLNEIKSWQNEKIEPLEKLINLRQIIVPLNQKSLAHRMSEAWRRQDGRNKVREDTEIVKLNLVLSKEDKRFLIEEAKRQKKTKNQLIAELVKGSRKKFFRDTLRQNRIG